LLTGPLPPPSTGRKLLKDLVLVRDGPGRSHTTSDVAAPPQPVAAAKEFGYGASWRSRQNRQKSSARPRNPVGGLLLSEAAEPQVTGPSGADPHPLEPPHARPPRRPRPGAACRTGAPVRARQGPVGAATCAYCTMPFSSIDPPEMKYGRLYHRKNCVDHAKPIAIAA
jgi:hypothetical protein